MSDDKKSLTLAYGEVTGHHHTMTSQEEIVQLTKPHDNNGIAFRLGKASAVLTHQEHGTMVLPQETDYVSFIKTTYNPETDRTVLDRD